MTALLSLPTDAAGRDGRALLLRPDVWRGRRSHAPLPATASGHAALDGLLPAQGWPLGALCEILHPADGVGELELLLPALARLAQTRRPVLWVAPPYLPYAPALRRHGLDLAALHVVAAGPEQAPWAAEQALRAGCCAAVLLWPQRIRDTGLRRLQLAAETGRCHGFVFRDSRHAGQASPAPLRLAVRRDQDALRLRIVKCRGLLAPPAGEITLADPGQPDTAEATGARDEVRASQTTGTVVALHGRSPR